MVSSRTLRGGWFYKFRALLRGQHERFEGGFWGSGHSPIFCKWTIFLREEGDGDVFG
jgi:hypothetical protein